MRANEHLFTSVMHEIKAIIRHEHPAALYRGIMTTITGGFIPTLIYVYLYENLNRLGMSYFHDHQMEHKLNYLLPILTNPIAEGIALIFYVPSDIVRTRLQHFEESQKYKGAIDCFKKTIKNEGLFRLYSASHIFMVNALVSTTIQMTLYEYLRSYYLVHNQEVKQISYFRSIQLSFISTTIAAMVCNPMEIILTRFQLADSNIKKPKGFHILQKMISKEGYLSLLKGIIPKLVGNSTLVFIFYPVYEHYKEIYGVSLHDQLNV